MNQKNRIRDWKGALHDEPRLVKIQMFVMFLVLAVSLTFIQFGFIGIGTDGQYVGYAMGLLLPISATAFLLGKGAGALQGVLSGAMLLFHATFQPLNLVERYFVSWLNSIVLFSFAGFIIGLFLAVALRNNPTGRRRTAYIAVASLLASLVVTVAFLINVIINYIMQSVQIYLQTNRTDVLSKQLIGALNGMGSMSVQIGLDFVLICGVVLLLDYYTRHFYKKKSSLSVRTSFGIELFVVVLMVFSVLSALSYVFITQQVSREVFDDMSNDATRLGEQLKESYERIDRILDSGVVETMSDETFGDIVNASYMDSIISAYDLSRDGTVMVMYEDFILYSNNPAFPVGKTASEVFGDIDSSLIKELVSTGGFHEILYDTKAYEEGADSTAFNASSTAELGYMHAVTQDDYRIFIVMPFSRIFESRQVTMGWSGMLSFILLGVVYVLTSRLLARDVVNPIDRTNESLARITGGDLDVMIEEEGNVEFTSLSSGINTTVGALKGYIHETEVRMERELATAKAIQSSAIPRVFPPFPEVDKFDIFASMDAAKEVGGDFYDFFLIDDHTLGFLIADVSGKGIPGALFMMAAKTELENYMSTGMELSQAIATANSRLCANNDAGMFVTVWAATLDYDTGEVTYVNAGHNFPLLRHGFDGRWEWLKKRCGLFLGTFETAKYRSEKFVLEPGDELILYTDGVNEAFNVDEKEYGNDRLERFLATHSRMHSREIVRSLRADVARWAEGAEQSDDVTILALEYGVAPEVTGTITVQATVDNLDAATSLVINELDARLCPVGVRNKVEVALEELFVNVCRYAYAGQDKPGTVQVSYAYGVNPSTITVELRDTGMPFDPIRHGNDANPFDARMMGVNGLGIYMVQKTMDEFTYMRSGNTNVVIIKKGW